MGLICSGYSRIGAMSCNEVFVVGLVKWSYNVSWVVGFCRRGYSGVCMVFFIEKRLYCVFKNFK